MKRVLILMIEGGGGHRASAQAIAEALTHLYGGQVTTTIVDVSKKCSFPLINQLDDIYRWLTSDGVWMWKALLYTDGEPWIPETFSWMLTPFFSQVMEQIYRAEVPDLVVSVHSFANHIPLRVLRKKLRADIPFVTVVTDMVTVHPAWICPEVDYCMVPTETARQYAVHYGMPSEHVEVVGQPVSLSFAKSLREKRDLRRRLGLDSSLPCVLVMGGGDGMGPVYEISRAIAAGAPDIQLIVVAGRNAALKERLENTSWEIATRVYGFVDNIPELMGASDLLVTKAGPGTLAEAFIAGLPVIISGFIPGPEEGNVEYVLEHQAGAYAEDPAEIARVVRECLRPGVGTIAQMTANAAALARPDATLVIAERLYHLLGRARGSATVWPDWRLFRHPAQQFDQ
jgi:1,2-diacylglycerol 3-beta-galactosyltransferase